jgi:hypothetical protein
MIGRGKLQIEEEANVLTISFCTTNETIVRPQGRDGISISSVFALSYLQERVGKHVPCKIVQFEPNACIQMFD